MEYAPEMGRITQMGAWLSVIPSNVNGTQLGTKECRYYLLLMYSIKTPDLLDH